MANNRQTFAWWKPSVLACLLLTLPAAAQIVNDGATNTLSNVTNSFAGDVTVGTNGSFTLLILSDNVLLTNSANSVIGLNLTAKSNEVRLVSASARWRVGGSLFIGSNGAASRLMISNGAFVENNNGVLGSRTESSNNVAVVTGGGSLWSNRNTLTIGSSGRGNQMTVSNGGWVINRTGDLGVNSGASNNLVLISGSGSVWSNALNLRVGALGPSNRLVIEAGGLVYSASGMVGDFNSASNNEALVAGASSLWTNNGGLTIGSQIGFNRLVVSNGAAVRSASGVMGSLAAAVRNQVVVTGDGSVWTNQTLLLLGGNSVGNRADVTDGGWLACSDGYVGSGFTGNSNTVVLSGGSGWNNLGTLRVGDGGSANTLIASNGATVLSSNAFIGASTSLGNNNFALLTDAGTLWSNQNDFTVGNFSFGNRLVVSNGAALSVGGNLYVGANSGSGSNRVVVDGGTLRVTNAAGTSVLDVRRGTNVLNSGTIDVDVLLVTNQQGRFEFNGGTLITRAITMTITNVIPVFAVNGIGATPATWDVRAGVSSHVLLANLLVGSNSPFNQLLITNGATLDNGSFYNGHIGYSTGANSNTARLSGTGSVWKLGALFLGYDGSANQLIVSNGARVVAGGDYSAIGFNPASTNNTALVTGSGSLWNNLDDIYVGGYGDGNRLVISNGATVNSSFYVRIGGVTNANENEVVVTGAGSYLTCRGVLIGDGGSANRLTISDGSAVVNREMYVGGSAGSTNNRVVVDGGTLRATNAAAGVFDVRRGTNALNAGLVDVDRLLVTNTLGVFEFNGGTLRSAGTTVANGRLFTVGDGTKTATVQLSGGSHVFANPMLIASNATLTGAGTIIGSVAVLAGGKVSPGDGIGTLVFSNAPSLGGTIYMEAFKVGATKFNDQIQIANVLFYGGSLTVSNIGVTAFAAGDNFKLFDSMIYSGSFSTLILPPLDSGLEWTNKLTVDGSIEVIAVSQPKFSGITLSGTNVVISGTNGTAGANYAVLTATNVALPLSNWVSIATNQFDSSGNFSFTNSITPGIPQRFFRMRTP